MRGAGRAGAATQEGAAAGSRTDTVGRALHVVAGAVVLAGILATFLRPLAPDLGPAPPPTRWFDDSYLALAEEFRRPRYLASALGLGLRVAVPCLVAWTPLGRRLTSRLVDRLGGRPVLSAVAIILAVVIVTDLVVLPVSFWAGYLHDGAYGLRTQGLGGWVRDWVALTLPEWGLVAVLVAVGWWLAGRLPRLWHVVGSLAACALLVALVVAEPFVLEPLRFQTEPLPPGEVRDAVEDVVERSGQHVERIVVADASRRSVRQNAYVTGLGNTRRIVLYDTLVVGQPPANVAQVVAHELAHDRHADVGRSATLGAAGLVLAAYALRAAVGRRVRLGRQASANDPRAAPVVLALVVLLLVASHPAQNWVSRRQEAAADLGALDLTQDPETYEAQRLEITRANLAHPSPPAWARALWATHPSTAARLHMGERWPLDWRGPVRP